MTDLSNADLLKKVTAELTQASEKFTKEADSALKEARRAGELSEETKAKVDELALTFNTLTEAERQLKARLGEVEQELVALPGRAPQSLRETPGAQVIKSQALKEFAASIEGGRRISIPVQAALLSPDLPEGVIEPQRLPGIDVLPKRRLFVRDLLAPGTTDKPALWLVQQSGFTNRAAVVPEGTKKPYSDIKFTTKMTAVSTLAHMFKASKQVLDDMPALMSQIDTEMRFGLKSVEEDEILFGDGTGQHLHGIVPQAVDFKAAFDVERRSGIDDLRLAMLQTQIARLPASGHVLHMIDWARIELTKDANGNYILANPLQLAGPTLWGLPVVPTDAPAFEGKFLTGAFNSAAQIFDREQANVVISTENATDFEDNMISVRCEERLALFVYRPEAFVYGEFTGAAAGAGA